MPWDLPEARRAPQMSHPSSRDICSEKRLLFSEHRAVPHMRPLLGGEVL